MEIEHEGIQQALFGSLALIAQIWLSDVHAGGDTKFDWSYADSPKVK